MKKLILLSAVLLSIQYPLFSFSGLPILRFNYQAGLPLTFKYNTNATDTKITPRNKHLSDFSIPYTLNSDLGAILKFNSRHSLVGFVNISYESDPVNRLFDPGVYLDNKFNIPDVTQEYFNLIANASHRWILNKNFVLTSTVEDTFLSFGNGKGDFAGNLLNSTSIGVNEEFAVFNWSELFNRNNLFLKNSLLKIQSGWNVNWRPNDENLADDANKILDYSLSNTSSNATQQESSSANVFAEQKEIFHNLNFKLEYNYSSIEDLRLNLSWKLSGDLYPSYLINDTNGDATENNRRFTRNTISLRAIYNTLYRGEKRFLLNFLLNSKIQFNRGNEIQSIKGIAFEDAPAFIKINTQLEKDVLIGLIPYEIISYDNDINSNVITNYSTNLQAFFPGYQDYNALVIDPHISFNPSAFFTLDAGYSFALKQYTGRYIKTDKGEWERYRQAIHMINLGMRFKNRSGHKSIYPFAAMQFVNSNDKSASGDIYYFGISTSLEF